MPPVRATDRRHERGLGQRGELPHRRDAEPGEPLARRGPDAPEPLDRERMEKLELGPGCDDEQAVGLGEIARELREQLGDRDADRRGEPRLVAHAAADRHRALVAAAVDARDAGNVEERLVGRDRLDERGERPEDAHDLAALLAVEVETGREEHAVGTDDAAPAPSASRSSTPKRRAS